ncbi:MAG: 30S ribosomal protein S24e [Methanotrichaceae archaeon]|nr:30S ribosomal protein S24e [Methanotrichaceae archaeon]
MNLEIKVIEENNNPLLDRREIIFKVTYEDATPSRKSIIDNLSVIMNSKQGLIIVDNIKTEFGKRESIGYAKIYESADRVKEIERSHIIERNSFLRAKEKIEGAGESKEIENGKTKTEAS